MSHFSSGALDSLRSLMQVWYDGTISGGQLQDKSGNARHANITNNLITDPGSELGNVFRHTGGTAPTINTSYTGDFHSGTRCYRMAWTSIPAFSLMKTEVFALKLGDVVNYSVWVKRVSSTTIFYQFYQGNGTTGGIVGTPSFNSATVGVWTQFSGQFTVTQPGGLSNFTINPGSGAHEILIDDISITITGESDNCFVLPVDATLQATDVNSMFYNSAGIPKTIRAAYTYGAWHNDKIYCGGAFSYLFFNTVLSISQDYLVYQQFHDKYFQATSCPVVFTCGSGGTYAQPQLAINAWRGGTSLDRLWVNMVSDVSVSTFAGHTATIGSNSVYLAGNKAFVYFYDVTQRRMDCAIEESATDNQMATTETISTIYSMGFFNMIFTKRNGGYLVHQHFTGTIDHEVVYQDCEFVDLGSQDLIDYRIANAQSYANMSNGKAAFAGGFVQGARYILNDCVFSGIYAWTVHDQDVDSATAAKAWLRNCTLTSDSTIYDPNFNPNATLHDSLLITSINGATESFVYLQRGTLNSTITETGSPQTITLEQI